MTDDSVQSLIDNLVKAKLTASRLSDDSSPCVVNAFLSTGCLVLDAIMGGGLPMGRIVEIYGDTSTGKSLIAAQACATVQADDGLAVYIDTETAVSLPIMEAVGVDIDNLVYSAPDTVEQVFKIMELAVESKPDDTDLLIIWDSIAATTSTAEMDKETGETGYLTHARVISQGLRKFSRAVAAAGAAVVFINQAKENIGVIFGDKVATFGGKAVGFHSSVRLQLKAGQKINKTVAGKKRVIGIHANARVTKNKIAPPFREATLPIYFGHGIDDDQATLEFLKAADVLRLSGHSVAWGELTFHRSKWSDIIDNHWDEIVDAVYEAASQGDLV